jgi:hypothetical protein
MRSANQLRNRRTPTPSTTPIQPQCSLSQLFGHPSSSGSGFEDHRNLTARVHDENSQKLLSRFVWNRGPSTLLSFASQTPPPLRMTRGRMCAQEYRSSRGCARLLIAAFATSDTLLGTRRSLLDALAHRDVFVVLAVEVDCGGFFQLVTFFDVNRLQLFLF